MNKASLFAMLLFLPFGIEARVFSFNNENLSSYFRGTVGLSNVGSDAFKGAGNSTTRFSDDVAYNFSGELGFALTLGQQLTVKFAAEILQTKPLDNIKGENASGVEQFRLNSEVFIFNPKAEVEFIFYQGEGSRAYGFVGAGLADITLDNQFTLTAGNSLTVTQDYTEKLEATGISATFGVGYEISFVDNVTFSIEAGYRYLPIDELKFKNDVTTEAQGSVTKGTVATDFDGSKRKLDMGGIFVGAGFRFYIDLLD